MKTSITFKTSLDSEIRNNNLNNFKRNYRQNINFNGIFEIVETLLFVKIKILPQR